MVVWGSVGSVKKCGVVWVSFAVSGSARQYWFVWDNVGWFLEVSDSVWLCLGGR